MPYHGANIQTKFVITKQNFKKIMIMDKINNEVSLPYVNKAIEIYYRAKCIRKDVIKQKRQLYSAAFSRISSSAFNFSSILQTISIPTEYLPASIRVMLEWNS